MIHLALWIVSFVIVAWAAVIGFAILVATWRIWVPILGLIVLAIMFMLWKDDRETRMEARRAYPALVSADVPAAPAPLPDPVATVPVVPGPKVAPAVEEKKPTSDIRLRHLSEALPVTLTFPNGEAWLVAAYGDDDNARLVMRFVALDGGRLLKAKASNVKSLLKSDFCGEGGVLHRFGLMPAATRVIAYEDSTQIGDVTLGGSYCR